MTAPCLLLVTFCPSRLTVKLWTCRQICMQRARSRRRREGICDGYNVPTGPGVRSAAPTVRGCGVCRVAGRGRDRPFARASRDGQSRSINLSRCLPPRRNNPISNQQCRVRPATSYLLRVLRALVARRLHHCPMPTCRLETGRSCLCRPNYNLEFNRLTNGSFLRKPAVFDPLPTPDSLMTLSLCHSTLYKRCRRFCLGARPETSGIHQKKNAITAASRNEISTNSPMTFFVRSVAG